MFKNTTSAEHSRQDLNDLGFGPYEVNFVDNFVLDLKNGEKISINVWFPKSPENYFPKHAATVRYCDAAHNENFIEEANFPAIMEYLPYCKSHWTAERDYLRHPWMCSQGYVIMRVDMRGTGNSTGLYFDEYAKQEQEDACEIIDWISRQPWSNGSVGMFGKSWGGFNGLQVAFCQPQALKAVISIYSTDNRYTDDCHFKGGCVIGTQMLSWAAVMFPWNARPPHPEKFAGYENKDSWKEEWKKRLEEASESWTEQWLSRQVYDDYWKPGSVCEDYSRIRIPVLAIGGWHDMYSNAVFRLVDNVPKCRGLIGPWSHDWPDVALPGPQIGFLPECLDFWDHHLKGKPSTRQEEAKKITWYQCFGSIPPAPSVKSWPGQWRSKEDCKPEKEVNFYLSDHQVLSNEKPVQEKSYLLTYDSNAGLTCGEMLSFGAPDLPGEQRFFNLPEHTWTSSSLENEVDIFGFPIFSCSFKILNDTHGQLVAKLCDVFPDGKSRLLSYGVINLNHYKSDQTPEELVQGQSYDVTFKLDAIGYRFLSGHQIAISMTPSYFPAVWTPRKATSIEINSATFSIPVIEDLKSERFDTNILSTPIFGPKLKSKILKEPFYKRYLEYGLSDEKKSVVTINNSGRQWLKDEDVILDEDSTLVYSADGNDNPLTARAEVRHKLEMQYFASNEERRQKIDISTSNQMSADENNFYLEEELNVCLNGETFFTNKWNKSVPRNFL